MSKKVKLGVVGLGKMGISHLSIANAYPETEVSVCDTSGFVLGVLSKNTDLPVYKDYKQLLALEKPDGVIIATPNRLHAGMVQEALERGIGVFCEKPFCLDWRDSENLTNLAEKHDVVNQVGYHYRFVGAFQEAKRIVESGVLGKITHVLAEAYGPVVLRAKGKTWRSNRVEGGGCLYDYAAHPINLVNWFFGKPSRVSGTIMNSIFSDSTDDEVYSTFLMPAGMSAHVSVNWSDDSCRKMTTKISMTGTNGRLYADRQECQLYLRKPDKSFPGYNAGWNVRYTTELTDEVGFYLRGEEYSAQTEQFVRALADGDAAPVNSFRSALETDQTLAMMISDRDDPTGQAGEPAGDIPARRRWFSRNRKTAENG